MRRGEGNSVELKRGRPEASVFHITPLVDYIYQNIISGKSLHSIISSKFMLVSSSVMLIDSNITLYFL